nr:fimbria/pilus periplasmic chaperone [Shigella sonnei]
MGTRVVYPATQKSISIRLNNDNESPALVQSWALLNKSNFC